MMTTFSNQSKYSDTEKNPRILSRFEDISPEKALVYLNGQGKNRAIRKAHVKRLADDMLKGMWEFPGDPIKFSESRKLIDGQHRLQAVVESNTTQRFLILTGFPERTIHVLDTGVGRSSANVGQIKGLDINHVDTATIASMSLPDSLDKMTNSFQLMLFEKYNSGIKFVGSKSGSRGGGSFSGTGKEYPNAPLRALIAKAYYYENVQRLGEFLDIYMTGFYTQEADTSAIALRNLALGLKLSNSFAMTYANKVEWYLQCQWALHNFLARKPLTRIIRRQNTKSSKEFSMDRFPLPGIQANNESNSKRFKSLNSVFGSD